MGSKIKFIYFDIGNVFLTFNKVFDKVVSDFGINKVDFEAVYDLYDRDANMGKIDIPDVWKILVDKLNLRDGHKYDFIYNWISDYEKILPTHQLVEDLTGKIEMGIISNYYRGFYEASVAQGFIPKYNFSPVIVSAEVGLRKPNSDIFALAQSKIKHSGPEVLFIDDKQENLDTAKTLNWQTFCFDYRHPEESVHQLRQQYFINIL